MQLSWFLSQPQDVQKRFWHATLFKLLLKYVRWIVHVSQNQDVDYMWNIKRVLMPMRNTLLCQGFSLLCWWTDVFLFCSLKNTSLDIIFKQISECVRCWEQCTFELTQYVNVNIRCAHKWTQTCVLSACRPVMISLSLICNVNCFHTREVWKMLGWCPVSFLKCSIQQEKVHVLTVLTSGNILV